jgi:hypothetical protein
MSTLSSGFKTPLACVVPLLFGCFSYVPVTVETAPVGQDVRVFVTRSGMLELVERTDAGSSSERGPLLAGTLAGRDNNGLILRVPVFGRQAFSAAPVDQQLPISYGQIVEMELRQLDKVKTGVFVGGTVAALAGTWFGLLDLKTKPAVGQGDPPPGDEETWIPLFSIPFP